MIFLLSLVLEKMKYLRPNNPKEVFMLLRKITTGFVVQVFDTSLARFVSQEFKAGDQTEWLDEDGKDMGALDPYLPFQMVQPTENDDRIVTIDFMQSMNPLHMKPNGTPDKILIVRDVLKVFREYGMGLLEAKTWVDGHHLTEIRHSAVAKLMDLQLQFRIIG